MPAVDDRGEAQAIRFLLNVIWLIFGGLLLAIGYALISLLMFILIITIPFGSPRCASRASACGRSGARSSTRTLWEPPRRSATSSTCNAITGVVQCATIHRHPLGLANFKMIPISLTPLGHDIVSTDQASGGTTIPSSRRRRRR